MRTDNKEIKKDIEKFSEELVRKNYYFYAVTLTYRDKEDNKNSKAAKYYKIPNHKIAIGTDFKNFKDKMIRAYKKKGINLEFYFIYAKHKSKKSCYERSHMHGIIAVSRRKKLDKHIKKLWKKGFVRIRKIYYMQGWINYLEGNMNKSKKYYSERCQIYSKTRIK